MVVPEAVIVNERRELGAHEVLFEPPDLSIFRARGDISAADVGLIRAEVRRLCQEREALFSLVDLTGLGAILPEARSRAARPWPLQIQGIAVIGAGFLHRVVITAVDRALARLFRGDGRFTPHFFATEAEARAWLDQRRRAWVSRQRRP
uniref:STAS/SEC14 domain-containing protein n=1 Tax=Jahnella sp. MSr9139 TaxID=1434086 RepID=A0A3Q8I2C7_9BACT|nr:hypothetical protein [Jahnella sp. MSr9139]